MAKQKKARSFGSILLLLVIEILALIGILMFFNRLLSDALTHLPISMDYVNVLIVVMVIGVMVIDFIKGVQAISKEKKRKRKKQRK